MIESSTVKPRLSELRLSEHLIIRTLCLGSCVYAYVLNYPNVIAWSQLVRIIEVALLCSNIF